MKQIPRPTEADHQRDMDADYDFARKCESKGDIAAMACAHMRLAQELRKQIAELKHSPEMP